MVNHGYVRTRAAAAHRVTIGLLAAFLVLPAFAQSAPPPASSPEVQTVADGWSALKQGNLGLAGKIAERAIAEYPRSPAAAVLAVEVDIVRGGTLAGLAPYERWLGDRPVDDPYVLRRVAHAHLRRVAADRQHPARLEAATALAAEGEADVQAELSAAAAKGGLIETEMLASIGDPRAVQNLVAALRAPAGSKVRTIKALGDSGSAIAVRPLLELLNDVREEHRAAAAEALGRLGAAEAIPSLKPLLNDPVFPVRVAAASALYRLQDYGGVNLLEELMASEHGAVRLGAVEALSVRPTGSWLGVVRDLTRHEDATVQLGAARLIAPYEPEVARAVLERLGASENPAVREEAARTFVRQLAADFSSLRRFLRNPDALTSVRAAARILELTR